MIDVKYNYTPELKRVLDVLKDVRKSQSYRNLCDSGANEKQVSTIRRAYLASLRCDLINLSLVLDAWIEKGARMEIGKED